MKGVKPLLPTLKENKRYIAFECTSEKNVSFSAVDTTLNTALRDLIGEKGAAQAGLLCLSECWSQKKQRGIARINTKYVDALKASHCFITSIEGTHGFIKSIGTSGVLSKAKKHIAA